MIAHLSAFVPVVGFIWGPLLVWLKWREHSDFVAAQAKEALNFNLTVAMGLLLSLPLLFLGIGVPLAVMLTAAWLVLTLVAALKASHGIDYRYPVSLRLVR